MLSVTDVVPWYLNPILLPAASGLFGVIVGGLITAASSYLLEQRRECREQQKENRAKAINVITAARLIELDFRKAQAFANVSAENKRWLFVLEHPPSMENWEKYCASLASEVGEEDWIDLVTATRAIEVLTGHYRRAVERDKRDMSEGMAAHIKSDIKPALARGQKVMLQLSGGKTLERNLLESGPNF
jgi:hypothetical protein